MERIKGSKGLVTAIFLGRSYTIYDDFVSRDHCTMPCRGLAGCPSEFILNICGVGMRVNKRSCAG